MVKRKMKDFEKIKNECQFKEIIQKDSADGKITVGYEDATTRLGIADLRNWVFRNELRIEKLRIK